VRLGLLLLSLIALASCAGDPGPPAAGRAPHLRPPTPGALRLGGSGAMLPLAVALGRSFAGHGLRIVVEESLGSGGGARAAAEGAVDLGLISRALSPAERRLGLTELRVATDAVVVAGGASVPVDNLTSAELRALYAEPRGRFADGTLATVLLRDRGESANAALERAVPGLRAWAPWPRRRVLYHEAAMIEALASTPSAIGVASLGGLAAGGHRLRPLALDRRRPSLEALADGSWPATRPLSFVARPDRLERARPFLAFIRSEAGRRISRELGFLPDDPSHAP
jgi:phosphate transport system substrate-binding protein